MERDGDAPSAGTWDTLEYLQSKKKGAKDSGKGEKLGPGPAFWAQPWQARLCGAAAGAGRV